MASEIAKQIILDELQEQRNPEPVEDVIYWALKEYGDSAKIRGNTWGRVIAGAIALRIDEAEKRFEPLSLFDKLGGTNA